MMVVVNIMFIFTPKVKSIYSAALNPIQDGPFRGCFQVAECPLPQLCPTYPTMMK